MRDMDGRVAKLEAAVAEPARVHVLAIGEHGDEAEAVVRRFADPDAPAQRLGGGTLA